MHFQFDQFLLSVMNIKLLQVKLFEFRNLQNAHEVWSSEKPN